MTVPYPASSPVQNQPGRSQGQTQPTAPLPKPVPSNPSQPVPRLARRLTIGRFTPDLRDALFLWGNGEYARYGEMIDQWADMVPGFGGKVDKVATIYGVCMAGRTLIGTRQGRSHLTTMGIFPRNRRVEVLRYGSATAVVFVAPVGSDLYLSWRVYNQGYLSFLRFLFVFLRALILSAAIFGGLYITYVLPPYYWVTPPFMLDATTIGAIAVSIVAGFGLSWGITFFRGLTRMRDWWGMLREPITSLQLDDALVLGFSVHHSLLEAADVVGIDISKLLPRTPTNVQPLRRRI